MSPTVVEAIIVALVRYGPEVATSIIALFQKKDVTVADIEALFAQIKTYESYGIKDRPV